MIGPGSDKERLEGRMELQEGRMRRARQEKRTVLAQVSHLGTLGLTFVLPVVGGAYLGHWLDDRISDHYSAMWTTSLILVGAVIGAVNVFQSIERSRDL